MAEYIVSYDVYRSSGISEQLLAFVKENRNVDQWSQPYHGLFLIKSNADLMTITESFRSFFGSNVGHFITPTSVHTSGGILPEEIWNWLRTDHNTLSALLTRYSESNQTG